MSEVQAAEQIDKHPVDASKSGKNAFYHFCDIRGGQQNYAVCMHILDAIKADRISNDQFTDCQRACTRDECPAKAMRAEEVAAGHAIYFKPRINVNPINARPEAEAQANSLIVSSGKYDMNNQSYARGWAQVGAKLGKENDSKKIVHRPAFKNPPAPKPAAKKDGFVHEDMAALVNVMMSESKSGIAEKTTDLSPATKPAPIKPLPGETPVEFARRRAAALKDAK